MQTSLAEADVSNSPSDEDQQWMEKLLDTSVYRLWSIAIDDGTMKLFSLAGPPTAVPLRSRGALDHVAYDHDGFILANVN